MKTILNERVAAFHESKNLVYVVSTGAGAGVQNILTSVPGASKTLLESIFPYSNAALVEFLGKTPEKYASEETARLMAIRARENGIKRANKQKADPAFVVGVGLTAVVGTNRKLRGAHRVFVGLCNKAGTFVVAIEFEKNPEGLSLLGRERECELADLFAVNALFAAAGIEQIPFPTLAIKSEDLLRTSSDEAVLRLRPVVAPAETFVRMNDGATALPTVLSPEQHVLFEGAFNPLHEGHKAIGKEVEARTGKTVVYVLSADHPEKGSLAEDEVNRRVKQFEWFAPIMVTHRLPLFINKAKAFPGFGFVMGSDALKRMLDPKYYSISIDEMLREFNALGTHFYVALRNMGAGEPALDEILATVPAEFHSMFNELAVRSPCSSTAIRAQVA